jgi:flagellar biosynthesis protein FlhB
MAEGGGQDKTEPREDGDVPRSKELATFAVLMTAGAGLWATGGNLAGHLSTMLASSLSLTREQIYNPTVLIERITNDIGGVLLACLPLAWPSCWSRWPRRWRSAASISRPKPSCRTSASSIRSAGSAT